MGIGVAELALAVLGVMMVSAEYPTGLIRVSLSAVPHRSRLLAAKTAVFALVGLVIGELLSFAAFAIGQLVISGTAPTATLGQPGVLRAVAGTGLFLTLIGVLGVALGALVRSTTAGVAVMVAMMFVLPGLGQVLPESWRNPMLKFWPTQAGAQMQNVAHQAHTLGPWAGLGLLAGFTAIVGAAAAARLSAPTADDPGLRTARARPPQPGSPLFGAVSATLSPWSQARTDSILFVRAKDPRGDPRRVVSPPELTDELVPVLQADAGVINLTVLPASVANPEGDAILFDLLQGRANDVLERLQQFELVERGSISIEPLTTFMSSTADRARLGRPRFDEFTPVWVEVESRIRSDGRFPPSWYVLLVIAGLIAAVGLLTNSEILIVGAMVVGPEYGAIVALAFGATRRDWSLVARSTVAMVLGFGLAVIGALLLGLVIRAAGLQPAAFALGIRPVSDLINTPDWYSVIVAVLAGVVGVISLAEARAGTLIGVFISVTTIPAAADIGVSVAFGSYGEAQGSAEQLLLNVFLLAAVAALGIPAQRALWRRITRPSRPSPTT